MGGDGIGGVGVEALIRSVVAHGGARVGVSDSGLDVAYVDVCGACGGNECVSQAVRGDGFVDADCFGDPVDDSGCVVTVKPATFTVDKQRPSCWFAVHSPGFDMCAYGCVRAGCEYGPGGDAAFASDLQHLVMFDAVQVADVRCAYFGDAEPVEKQQADKGVISGADCFGVFEESCSFGPGERLGHRLIRHLRTAHEQSGVACGDAFGFEVPVEGAHGGDAAGDGGG